MRTEIIDLTPDSSGTTRKLTCLRFGTAGARPKVYLQAGLHADEMPGVLVLQHLVPLLDAAEAQDRLIGEVLVVPFANPIGASQWLQHRPLGRQDIESMQNFNRGYPDLAALVGESLDTVLSEDAPENIRIVRGAFGAALDRIVPATELQDLRLALMKRSYDADYVLDLHCDHRAILHLYASPALPRETSLLCRSIGAELALIQEVSGGNAFDEAHSAPWAALRRSYEGVFTIPAGCFAATLEYRGQMDVDDAVAARDAHNLMTFLTQIGALRPGGEAPRYPDPPHLPLGGAVEAVAPQGGIVTWIAKPGDLVTKGQVLAHVTDPVSRLRMPVEAPAGGLMYRARLWRSCLRGQGLAHVAGKTVLREGHLLAD